MKKLRADWQFVKNRGEVTDVDAIAVSPPVEAARPKGKILEPIFISI